MEHFLLKGIVLLGLAAIVSALGSAFLHLRRGREHGVAVVRALTWRVALSVGLFLFLLIASQIGLFEPHQLR